MRQLSREPAFERSAESLHKKVSDLRYEQSSLFAHDRAEDQLPRNDV